METGCAIVSKRELCARCLAYLAGLIVIVGVYPQPLIKCDYEVASTPIVHTAVTMIK